MNTPNILSNDLDQVPKTGKWYREALKQKELKTAIDDAFFYSDDEWADIKEDFFSNDHFFVRAVDKEVNQRFLENKESLPMEQVVFLLETHPIVSCEIARRAIKTQSGG
jgi:hypothetical protein